jgi:hypothetical protein
MLVQIWTATEAISEGSEGDRDEANDYRIK